MVSGYLNPTDAWISDYKRVLSSSKGVQESSDVKWPLYFKFAYSQSVRMTDRLPLANQLPPKDSLEWMELRLAINYDAHVRRANETKTARIYTKGGKQLSTNEDWHLVCDNNFLGVTLSIPALLSGRFVLVTKHFLLEGRNHILPIVYTAEVIITRTKANGTRGEYTIIRVL